MDAVTGTHQSLTIENGIHVNGIHVNGIHVNGIHVNGIHVNGIHVNGIHVNGIHVNGIHVNGIHVNGIHVNGIALNGLYLNGIGLNGVGLDGIGTNAIGVDNPGSYGLYLSGIGLPLASFDAVGTDGTGIAGAGLRGLAINGLYADGSGTHGITINGAGLIDVPLSGFGSQGLVVNGIGADGIGLGGSAPQDNGLEDLNLNGTLLQHIGLEGKGRPGVGLRRIGLNGLFLGGPHANALTVNGLDLIDVPLNDLAVNGSGIGGILRRNGNGQVSALSWSQEKALEQVLFHLAACALPAGDAITIVASDGTPRTYQGLRGFAPEWAELPLTEAGAEQVRACLISSEGSYEAGQLTPEHETVLETVLFHLVACALPAGDAITIAASDGTPRTYQGLRGFAPHWKTEPLDQAGEERVRACLQSSPDAVFDLAFNEEQENSMKSLLSYMVECALSAEQSVTIYDGSGAPQTYRGTMGLAPEWASGPLSQQGEHLVSACLAARSNTKGSTVNLSLRGGGLPTTEVERAVYRHHEGAFWGNLFSDEPYLYTCSVDGASISGRECTTEACGFQYMGRCDEVCARRDPVDGHYTDCAGDTDVINTFLYITEQNDSGQDHNCVRRNGTLWCWGDNQHGQLGDGTFQSRAEPLPVLVLGENVAEVGGGAHHTCARRKDASVWCWGDNQHGQLGVDTAESKSRTPLHVSALAYDVASLGVAANHACALKTSGTLWCWGDNFYGQLGTGDTAAHGQPVQVEALGSDVIRIALDESAEHTCALTNDGTPWCWGWNSAGQLGDGTTDDRNTPSQVAVTADGQAFGQVTDMCTGWLHTCARRTDGSVWCWGSNASGQLGSSSVTSTLEPHPVQVSLSDKALQGSLSCGSTHTCTMLDDGSVRCWGGNQHGQLGSEILSAQSSATPVQVTNLSGSVASVSADASRTCATMVDDTLACWGHDTTGLFLGTAGSSTTPVALHLPETRRYAPIDFQVRFAQGRKDVLRWDAHLAGDLAGYQIYRDGVLIATVSAKHVRWHSVLPFTGACYAIRAVFADGTASELSDAVCQTI